MTTNKEQFPLPFNATIRSCRRRSLLQRQRHSAPLGSTGEPQNDQAVLLPQIRAQDADMGRALVTAPTFVALTDLANLRAAGIAYPSTIHGWRWLFRHRRERGLEDAFRRIGRRIVVDPERYRELVRARPAT